MQSYLAGLRIVERPEPASLEPDQIKNEVVYEREDRTPGESQSEKTPSLQDRLFYDSEEPTEDLFDSDDDRPYEPPDSPLPYEEYGRGNENRENRI